MGRESDNLKKMYGNYLAISAQLKGSEGKLVAVIAQEEKSTEFHEVQVRPSSVWLESTVYLGRLADIGLEPYVIAGGRQRDSEGLKDFLGSDEVYAWFRPGDLFISTAVHTEGKELVDGPIKVPLTMLPSLGNMLPWDQRPVPYEAVYGLTHLLGIDVRTLEQGLHVLVGRQEMDAFFKKNKYDNYETLLKLL